MTLGDEAQDQRRSKIDRVFVVATAITAIWLVAALVVLLSARVDHSAGGFLQRLTANEWGDFLAGVFAPVAFFWLAAAVWLQARELRAQREELALTRKEFALNRKVLEAQAAEIKEQANALKEQTALMAEERDHLRRTELEADVKAAMTGIGMIMYQVLKDRADLPAGYVDPDDKSKRIELLQRLFTRRLETGKFSDAPEVLVGLLSLCSEARPWIEQLPRSAYWRLEAGRVDELAKKLMSKVHPDL